MHSGNFALILHSHLPWVLHHGNWPHGSDWLCEAAAECYIPLINVFNELLEDGIRPAITIGLSPILCEQLEHPDFKELFVDYCNQKIKEAQQDELNFKGKGFSGHQIYLAQYWQKWYSDRKNDFIELEDNSILKAFRNLQDNNAIEIITCGATHGYFPLLGDDSSIHLQVRAAVENYKKYFGKNPKGSWLPECAYRPSYKWKSLVPISPFNEENLRSGSEQFLSAYDITHFVIDDELLINSSPIGIFNHGNRFDFVDIDDEEYKFRNNDFSKSSLKLYNIASSKNVEFGTSIAFTRNKNISLKVWSGEVGYPGEPNYLDFHKKQFGSMLRYWKVTDNKADMMYKQLYQPDDVDKNLDLQSNNFIKLLEDTAINYKNDTGEDALICTPFDTELFGHWWFEGPRFLKYLIKGINHSPYLNMTTTSEEIERSNPHEIISIPEGSWGENNNHDVWSNPENVWTWEAIYNNEKRLKDLFHKYPISEQNPLQKRIFKQALRELMLLQSSDWQFLIYTRSAKDYSETRFSNHHSDFNKLCDLAVKYSEYRKIEENDEKYLIETEKRDSVFSELELKWWSPLKF